MNIRVVQVCSNMLHSQISLECCKSQKTIYSVLMYEELSDELTLGLEGDMMSYVCERKSRRSSRVLRRVTV